MQAFIGDVMLNTSLSAGLHAALTRSHSAILCTGGEIMEREDLDPMSQHFLGLIEVTNR